MQILKNNSFPHDLIIGRDFITKEKLTVIYKPEEITGEHEIQLLPRFDICEVSDTLEDKINNCLIDFDKTVKRRLKQVILQVENMNIPPIEDDYTVRVNLKDKSIFAFAPRRFAFAEREQVRDITDDLLKRGIIKPSVSPYCSRVVPVRKKMAR